MHAKRPPPGGYVLTLDQDLPKNPRNNLPGGKINPMERELCFGQQRIRFDREATTGLYRDIITVPGSERCTCISCKNFAAQRTNVFSEEFLRFLKELGVPPLGNGKPLTMISALRIRISISTVGGSSFAAN